MQRLIVGAIACGVALGLAPGVRGQGRTFLGEPVSRWKADLGHKDPAVRRSAAFALGQLGGQSLEAVSTLLRIMQHDDNPGVREMAASAIGDINASFRLSRQVLDKEVADALQKVLEKDADPRVQRSAAYALGTFGPAGLPAVDALKKALASPAAPVRQNAAWALGQIGPEAGPDGVAALVKMLADQDALVRRDAAGALGEFGEVVGAPAVAPLMNLLAMESDAVVCKIAVGSLTNLVSAKHRSTPAEGLQRLLKDRDPETQLSAALVLAKIGGAKAAAALPVLQKALKDEDTHVQSLAAATLAKMGPDAAPAVVDLARALKDSPDRETRRNAALALGAIGKDARAAVPILAEALAPDVPVEVRRQAAEALAQIEFPNNEKAMPALRAAIQNDKDPLVRQRCVWALFQYRELRGDPRTQEILVAVLDEKADDQMIVRYDTARLLANALGPKAPDRTVEVLFEMLNNKGLRVFNRSDARVEAGNEANAGRSGVEANLGGDARYMAAQALSWLEGKLKNRPDVLAALKTAATDPDPELQRAAKKSLASLAAMGIK
jgi:HEAT repeat protein